MTIRSTALSCDGSTVWAVMDNCEGRDIMGVFPNLQDARDCVAMVLRNESNRVFRSHLRNVISFEEIPMGSILTPNRN
jgi:hypothetical protein